MSEEQAQPPVNASEIAALQAHAHKGEVMARSCGVEIDEPELSGDFDGGVRESANESLDPHEDHGNAVVEMLMQAKANRIQAFDAED